ncbi:LysR family transcriptional regulator [Catenovulum sp. 2E275]|uniref:LysR family transcriptional regulator n=1 Tax=Catenovulum sp. 2E275 TaxID=2980497 RepID=UPI0021CE572E|nr:LysR family transcriptional regulator [Catenovulum sp. 2E275]MCU4674250.1 LysR family transcriptional regulator [Catenovulum sp. 2E275]
MDIELAKTFLEIMSSGTFNEAAQRLNVTQTTVTARVKALEDALGKALFIRNRAGAKLTQDGERFAGFALNLVQTWEQAKQAVNLPENQQASIRIATEHSLWNPLMVDWIETIGAAEPKLNIYSQVGETETLITALEQNQLDIVLLHCPNYYSGFVVEQLAEEKLIHVQVPNRTKPDLFIDWGSEFKRQFDASLPQQRQAAMSFNLGPLALKIMLKNGGNGYFRTRVVSHYLAQGVLEKVTGAPEFTYPIYALYRKGEHSVYFEQALACLKVSVNKSEYWQV